MGLAEGQSSQVNKKFNKKLEDKRIDPLGPMRKY
jgi:hypothetical protein